ncbi:xylulokinase [Persicobacter psychrovividus]|uniref:Carbohydrate kinase n=1 Tax=Persicobacter psychrovividus TaxID=387638 RepID=A0ABM7VL48_9BACT|nr:carbohydrate kinase [Persicobacter psychrovividus]
MYFLGYDIGTSSVKLSVISATDGQQVLSVTYPEQEQLIDSPQAGWAEQSPEMWWDSLTAATKIAGKKIDLKAVNGIGITYQMHGLVLVNKQQQVLRPSIIWCDSRAVEIGNTAFENIGAEKCLSHCLNSPGNFTASKLKWVMENEPAVYEQVHKMMLPGDYIAMKLSGEITTTPTGLSEGILWDFKSNDVAEIVLEQYGISPSLIPDIVPTFGEQVRVNSTMAEELGLREGVPVCYRSGDQPNNALSLNVMKPGGIAATAGTSGVVYGVSDQLKYDPKSRVNTFAHVNHSESARRLGVLLCINGTGILNNWMRQNVAKDLSYPEMNELASSVAIGAEGLSILPFGNGAERVLENANPGASIHGLDFNRHGKGQLLRAAQEGIVFSFYYGMEVMQEIGIDPKVIRAGKANMFLSPIFRDTLAGVSGAPIELYATDGSRGAAMGAAYGHGHFASFDEAFASTEKLGLIEPNTAMSAQYQEAYQRWKALLK